MARILLFFLLDCWPPAAGRPAWAAVHPLAHDLESRHRHQHHQQHKHQHQSQHPSQKRRNSDMDLESQQVATGSNHSTHNSAYIKKLSLQALANRVTTGTMDSDVVARELLRRAEIASPAERSQIEEVVGNLAGLETERQKQKQQQQQQQSQQQSQQAEFEADEAQDALPINSTEAERQGAGGGPPPTLPPLPPPVENAEPAPAADGLPGAIWAQLQHLMEKDTIFEAHKYRTERGTSHRNFDSHLPVALPGIMVSDYMKEKLEGIPFPDLDGSTQYAMDTGENEFFNEPPIDITTGKYQRRKPWGEHIGNGLFKGVIGRVHRSKPLKPKKNPPVPKQTGKNPPPPEAIPVRAADEQGGKNLQPTPPAADSSPQQRSIPGSHPAEPTPWPPVPDMSDATSYHMEHGSISVLDGMFKSDDNRDPEKVCPDDASCSGLDQPTCVRCEDSDVRLCAWTALGTCVPFYEGYDGIDMKAECEPHKGSCDALGEYHCKQCASVGACRWRDAVKECKKMKPKPIKYKRFITPEQCRDALPGIQCDEIKSCCECRKSDSGKRGSKCYWSEIAQRCEAAQKRVDDNELEWTRDLAQCVAYLTDPSPCHGVPKTRLNGCLDRGISTCCECVMTTSVEFVHQDKGRPCFWNKPTKSCGVPTDKETGIFLGETDDDTRICSHDASSRPKVEDGDDEQDDDEVAADKGVPWQAEYFNIGHSLMALPAQDQWKQDDHLAPFVRHEDVIEHTMNKAPEEGCWSGLDCDKYYVDFAVRWVGCLKVPTTGDYSFETDSNDGSKLYVDGDEIVDNDGLHALRATEGTKVGMKGGGLYPIRVEFFSHSGKAAIMVKWQPPGGKMELLTRDHLVEMQDCLNRPPIGK